MKRTRARTAAQIAFATFSVALVAVAFLRGNYLLGLDYGVAYVVVIGGLLWFVARSSVLADKPSPIWAAVLTALSMPISVVMAFPASVNPEVQYEINAQSADRAARAELATVFASDPAYRGLSISTVHLKGLNVTIHGSLKDRADLDRLRGRIAGECADVHRRSLHWDVTLRNPAQRVEGVDSELFDGGG
jgi:hypothetical protein